MTDESAASILRRLADWGGLMRAPVCLLAFFGTYLGALLAGHLELTVHELASRSVFLLALSLVSLCAASMIFNDLFDVESDRINKPSRALAAGTISLDSARWVSTLLFAAAVLLAGQLGLIAALLVGSMVALSVLYTVRLKAIPWIGNSIAATIGAGAGLDFHLSRPTLQEHSSNSPV